MAVRSINLSEGRLKPLPVNSCEDDIRFAGTDRRQSRCGTLKMSLDDADRLAVLSQLRLIESRAEERFDRITRLASRAMSVPVALISIVDDSKQFFKSQVGLPEPWATDRQTPLTHSFCQHVVVTSQPLRVEDARRHPLVRDNQAISDLNVVAYLGMPLRAPSGHVLGSLCAIQSTPRAWSREDEQVLRDLADIVEDQIGLSISEKRWREILNTMPQMVWSTLPDGHHDFYNDRWYEFTGVPYGSTDGEGWNEMFHPDDQERAWSRWRHALATGELYEIEYRLRHKSGMYRWTLGRALPLRDGSGRIDRWFGTCTDIDDMKQAEAARDLISRELSHRIQNIFALVSGLVSLAARADESSRPFARKLVSRIQALAGAHRYVGDGRDVENVDQTIASLLKTVLAPYGEQVEITGQDCPIKSGKAAPLALLLHEFATNAVKYGSLSTADGLLRVQVREESGVLVISWTETNGPVVHTPTRKGFGTQLVESLRPSLGATIERAWLADGLQATITVPL